MHVSAHVGWFNSEAMNQSEEKKNVACCAMRGSPAIFR